jgi:hypothetical protein
VVFGTKYNQVKFNLLRLFGIIYSYLVLTP